MANRASFEETWAFEDVVRKRYPGCVISYERRGNTKAGNPRFLWQAKRDGVLVAEHTMVVLQSKKGTPYAVVSREPNEKRASHERSADGDNALAQILAEFTRH